MGTAKGPVPALIHICKHQPAISIRPCLHLESPPHPSYYPMDTHPGTRPLAWADSQGRRLACSGRNQGCSHSAALHKLQSRILGTHPHLQESKGGAEEGSQTPERGGGGRLFLWPLPAAEIERSVSPVFHESGSSCCVSETARTGPHLRAFAPRCFLCQVCPHSYVHGPLPLISVTSQSQASLPPLSGHTCRFSSPPSPALLFVENFT